MGDVEQRLHHEARDLGAARTALINARERLRELTSDPTDDMLQRAIIRAREAWHQEQTWEAVVRAVLDERRLP